jgi:hypothetical protein
MAALRFALPRGAAEPIEPAIRPEYQDLVPEASLQLALDRAITDLTEMRDRIEGGVRRRGGDYRFSPGDMARGERVFREGLGAVGEYRRRRPA